MECGGIDEKGVPLQSVERFDPRFCRWENVAPMSLSTRYGAGAALLNGEVYVAGGCNDYGTRLETVEK